MSLFYFYFLLFFFINFGVFSYNRSWIFINFLAINALYERNERRGIPAWLLAGAGSSIAGGLIDDCLVIPQRGVIRSLNVHIAAAVASYAFRAQYPIRDQ